jgi:diaminopimelate epimerase
VRSGRPSGQSAPAAATPPLWERTPLVLTTRSSSDSRGFVEAAQVLQEVAVYERGLDPRRAAISASVAALVVACGQHAGQLPLIVTYQ